MCVFSLFFSSYKGGKSLLIFFTSNIKNSASPLQKKSVGIRKRHGDEEGYFDLRVTALYPKSWGSRWSRWSEYGRECRFSYQNAGSGRSSIPLEKLLRFMLQLRVCYPVTLMNWGVHHPTREKFTLQIRIIHKSSLWTRSMNPPLWPSTSKLFLFQGGSLRWN